MKVTFEMDEQTLRNAIEAINCYLEMCDFPTILCQELTEEDMEDLELCLAAALVGDELHKAVCS